MLISMAFAKSPNLPVQKPDIWLIDFNPALHYRVRSIFFVGAGWNERVAFDKDLNFHAKNRIYGVRSFFELSVLKGLWILGDVERMNAFVPVNRVQHDTGSREMVWSHMMGVKKNFSFTTGVSGNVQFMYNLYDPRRTSPYLNRFNVRFGFEFPIKKERKGS